MTSEWAPLFESRVWPVVGPYLGGGALCLADAEVNELNRRYLGATYKGVVKAWVQPTDGRWPRPIKYSIQKRRPGKPPYEDFTVRQAIYKGHERWSYDTEYAKLRDLTQQGKLALLPTSMVTCRAAVTDDSRLDLLEVALIDTATLLAHCEDRYLTTVRSDGNQFYAVPFLALPGVVRWRPNAKGELERRVHAHQASLLA